MASAKPTIHSFEGCLFTSARPHGLHIERSLNYLPPVRGKAFQRTDLFLVVFMILPDAGG